MVLALDTSGSMLSQDALNHAKQAAEQLVRSLGPADQVAVISFDNQAVVRSEFSNDKDAVAATIQALQAQQRAFPADEPPLIGLALGQRACFNGKSQPQVQADVQICQRLGQPQVALALIPGLGAQFLLHFQQLWPQVIVPLLGNPGQVAHHCGLVYFFCRYRLRHRQPLPVYAVWHQFHCDQARRNAVAAGQLLARADHQPPWSKDPLLFDLARQTSTPGPVAHGAHDPRGIPFQQARVIRCGRWRKVVNHQGDVFGRKAAHLQRVGRVYP
ncbi:MAG: VWA domain-containing protein, partial [Delftia sp.]|nr:VWA domain-containing protein [Delftia sp.]